MAAKLQKLSAQHLSVVITDLKMPRISGLELLEEIQKRGLPSAVIVTTGVGGVEEAVRAVQLGATDFLTKPVDVDHLKLVVARALRERALLVEVAALREQMKESYSFHEILSKSSSMQSVFELIGHVADTNTTVLIHGETGTGKELVARAIHQASRAATARSSRSIARRCRRRCSKANCSAMRKARSPAPPGSARAASNWPTAARCFSTRSARFRWSMQVEASACSAGTAIRARRRHRAGRGRRARDRGHQPSL